MSTNHSHRIEQLFSKTKTICIGRFLLDVPDNAAVVYGPSDVPWPIMVLIGKSHALNEIIEARLIEVEDEKRFASGTLRDKASMVGRVIDGAAPGQKMVFGVSKQSGGIYRIDSYVKVKDNLFVQRATPIPADKDQTLQELNAIALALSSREQFEVPDESGVCIDGGFVAETAALTHEALNLGIRLSEYPDVHFSLSLTKKDALVESDALEPRIRQAEEIAQRLGQKAWYARIKTLRRGYRQLGNWRGFEILARKPTQESEGESHEFAFLSQGMPNDPLLPVLDLELHTGVLDNQLGGSQPSINDEEAMEIWDRLTSSVRVRPFTKRNPLKIVEANM